jgi:DNA polymerase elongation subunit (family B)
MTLWLIPASGSGKRLRLIDRSFRPAFYAHGPEPRLRHLARALAARAPVVCTLTRREDIWEGRELLVLRIALHHPTQFASLVRFVYRFDPGLRLYNSDLMLAPMYCWEKNVFPLAKVEVEMDRSVAALDERRLVNSEEPAVIDRRYSILAIESRDDEWAIDFELPPLQIMRARLEGLGKVDPRHGRRGKLEVAVDDDWLELDDALEPVAVGFERMLRAHDPDLIVSEWGDSTLFPSLLQQARRERIPLSLNRDPAYGGAVQRSRARSYTSYGRILFKASATTLFGRLHVDVQNSFIAEQCNLEGLWELVRVTKLPVQYCARTTTGTGISYMQMELAWRDGVLIPEQKAEPESPKHPDELLVADRGGLVFPPRLGFFENVAELDFISEFPSIMARFNVSPETVNCRCCPNAPRVPELGYRVCQRRRGITSRVVERLIWKREEYKRRIALAGVGSRESGIAVAAVSSPPTLTPDPSPRGRGEAEIAFEFQPSPSGRGSPTCRGGEGLHPNPEPRIPNPASYKERRSSLKWLLVCCFGYTGYKNARFGKIEAHEAINALAREKLLVAKETAERAGYRVLHALVDSLYVQRPDATREDYARMGREIEQQTGLPMALEAVYRYVVFLPSKQHAEVPVPNRFFCVPAEADGEIKIRGLECRRHDTAPIVARMQREALAIVAEANDYESYCRKLEEARQVLDRYLERVEDGSAPIEELIIRRRMTRPPGTYKQANATAIAARQLDRSGVELRPGEMIEYIITDADSNYPDDRFRAFTMWEGWRGYDVGEYQRALREAFKPLELFMGKESRMNSSEAYGVNSTRIVSTWRLSSGKSLSTASQTASLSIPK